ncbi:hypothetical protein ACWF94_14450 [Streptomyces sp. NPDC055078]
MYQRRDTGANDGEEREKRLDLSVPQVAGSAVAAVTAAVLASRLGVYGTIIGAGVVSVVATCGGSIFQLLFSRTGDQIRDVTAQARPGGRQIPAAPGNDRTRLMPQIDAPGDGSGDGSGDAATRMLRRPPHDDAFGHATTHGTRVRGWKRPLLAAAVVFGVTMTGITGYELVSGSGLDGGKGTTVGSVVRGETGQKSSPAERPSHTPQEREERPGTGDDRERDGEPTPGGDHSGTPPPGSGPDREQREDQRQDREGQQDRNPEDGDGTEPADPTPAPSRPAEEVAPTPPPSDPEPGASADGGASTAP